MTDNRETGTVKWFNTAKGFGFISRENGTDAFVHHSEIRGTGFRNLTEGERVEFGVTESEKGPRATDVVSLGGGQPAPAYGEERQSNSRSGDTLRFF